MEQEAEKSKNKTKPNLVFLPLNSVKTWDNERQSPGEPEAKSDEKEDQVRDSRLIGKREGNKGYSCEEEK